MNSKKKKVNRKHRVKKLKAKAKLKAILQEKKTPAGEKKSK
jgi:hypothetical protein